MASVRCPHCGDDIVPVPVESGETEGPTRYFDCPSCRQRLPIETIDEYMALEEEEASG
ncbi:MAG: hypothetical protein ACRDHM_07770 [Actinomycetota bacterium]